MQNWKSYLKLGKCFLLGKPEISSTSRTLTLVRSSNLAADAQPRASDTAVVAFPRINPDPVLNTRILELMTVSEPTTSRSSPISDEAVIQYEESFRKRFGFVWPTQDRIDLINLKRRFDLTDDEIKFLKWVGDIRLKPEGVVFWVPPLYAFYGIFAISVFLLVFGLPLASVALNHAGAAQFLKAVGGMVLLLVFCRLIYVCHVKSWTIKRRADFRIARRLNAAPA